MTIQEHPMTLAATYEENQAAAAIGHLIRFCTLVEDADPKVTVALLKRLAPLKAKYPVPVFDAVLDLVEGLKGEVA